MTSFADRTAVWPRSLVWSEFAQLTKVRLTSLVLVTTAAGFFLASTTPGWFILIATLLGTGLVASGAAAINQFLEAEYDALMIRTKQRPIPAGKVSPVEVLLLGITLSILGVGVLLVFVTLTTALLALLTLLSYLYLYTPAKRFTSWNTAIGAVSGALPPVIGCAAAGEVWGSKSAFLFALLWLWQMPHFLAIAWIYQNDYKQAGFHMLPFGDSNGMKTAISVILSSLLLIGLLPVFYELGTIGFIVTLVGSFLGTVYAFLGFRFAYLRDTASARLLFLGSVFYLPLILGLLVFIR